jgi:FkbM family methyltransferase
MVLEKTAGVRIYSIQAHAREDWFDIRKSGCRMETVFDVGANVGQSARKFRYAFPDARIFCFEPVESVFQELQQSVAADSRIECFQMAMGSSKGVGRVYLTDHTTTSSLIEPENSRGFEEIQIDTVDSFAGQHGIETIDLLKVDAEGFDLEVLKGADSLLSSARVAFVLIEVGFHPGDDRHVLFDHAREFLMARGFHVYGIYDQNLEWSGESRLRFANVCFANESAFKKS